MICFSLSLLFSLNRARAVELLSRYSGYRKKYIYEILKSEKLTKGTNSGVVSERKPFSTVCLLTLSTRDPHFATVE